MIEVRQLTKRYGSTTAVEGLSFTVGRGMVTGFLGPNGAGKSTTMRLILGLDRPDAGSALVDGLPYRELRRPLRHVGALLEAGGLIPGAPPTTTCSGWRRRRASARAGSARCSS